MVGAVPQLPSSAFWSYGPTFATAWVQYPGRWCSRRTPVGFDDADVDGDSDAADDDFGRRPT